MLLNYLLPFTKQKLIKENLLIFENIYALFFIGYMLYSIYDWITTSSTVLLFNASVYLKIYLITDLLLCSQELIVHHICSIILIQSSINIFCVNPILQHYIVIIYSTELSTLFLIFHILFEQFHIKNKLTDVNDLLFIITFAYTRIYLFTKYIIFDKQLYDLLYETVPYYNIICVCIYTLYILNLYWFFIIIKKLVKPLPKLSTYYCEKALKYTYFLSLVGSFYLYRSYHNILFTVDIIGQILLCISSYNYHYVLELELAKGNTEDKIDTLSNHIILKYLNDIICIHIRSAVCIVVHTNIFGNQLTHLNVFYMIISLLVHYASLYYHILFITDLKNKGDTYVDDHNSYKQQIINNLFGLPILVDTLICMTNTNFYVRTNLLVITCIIFIYSYIRPLYNMTHLGLHFLLGFQTLALCQSNIVANM